MINTALEYEELDTLDFDDIYNIKKMLHNLTKGKK